MTRKVQVHQVDAFTREPFTGNPTGVVLNADALSEAQMLAIARELNNAETAFILAPDADDHTVRARFFTPRSEAGFVGHATIAARVDGKRDRCLVGVAAIVGGVIEARHAGVGAPHAFGGGGRGPREMQRLGPCCRVEQGKKMHIEAAATHHAGGVRHRLVGAAVVPGGGYAGDGGSGGDPRD